MQSIRQTMIRKAGSCGNPAVEAVRTRAYQELQDMARVLDMPLTGYPFNEILSSLTKLLDMTTFLLNSGMIDPYVAIRSAAHDSVKPLVSRTLRIGMYPVAANPFHWAHLLIGLSALVRFRLDKIIYVISGSDPRKPALVPAEIRHLIGKTVLNIFEPFFGYSSLALENNCAGETNIFELIALNPNQKIAAHYIVGADHYHRVNPVTGDADTLQKLEKNIADGTSCFNPSRHSISAIFIERGTRDYAVETDVPVAFIPGMPFTASSTMLREAFSGINTVQTLALLPYTAFVYANAFSLYGSEFELPLQNNAAHLADNHLLPLAKGRPQHSPAGIFMAA